MIACTLFRTSVVSVQVSDYLMDFFYHFFVFRPLVAILVLISASWPRGYHIPPRLSDFPNAQSI